jgi:hypothetical protein
MIVMASKASPYIPRYIRRYIFRRNMVAMFALYLWMVSFVLLAIGAMGYLRSLTGWPRSRFEAGQSPIWLLCLFLPALALLHLRGRRTPVTAAIEIEQQIPQFDQRLITVASNPPGSSLLAQITGEVELIARDRRPKVSLRSLLAPVLAVVAAGLVVVIYR